LRPDFWGVPEQAAKISEELAGLKRIVEDIEDLQVETELLADSKDETAIDDLAKRSTRKKFWFFCRENTTGKMRF